MYSGLVNHCGVLNEVLLRDSAMSVSISSEFTDLTVGESIAVDGICLTVTDAKDKIFSCDLSPITLAHTTAKNWQTGKRVNLERCLRLQDRLGGHFVNGIVDEVGCVLAVQRANDFLTVAIGGYDASSHSFLVKKGHIAVNGVSLTIHEVNDDNFALMLIPETLMRTNLKALKSGQLVNLEYDMMVKTIAHCVKVTHYESVC